MTLNQNSEKYLQPNDININLKEHQLAMLNKCLEIEKNNEFSIMRDKPGSGKTFVVLSMIYELKKKDIQNKVPKKTNIIIVPQNIYFQWCYSIERLTENLSYLKFVEYEHLLNLYNEPASLYDKDIILVTSSYYNSLASTMTSLEINVDRLFIDEIDNVGNLINQNFNTKFTMFISASFSFDNNNGYFSGKLKDKKSEDITIVCDEKFIDSQIVLEDPKVDYYLCKNLYIDKVLVNVITEDELKNINACYYKLNDKNYNNIIAKDEKSLISLIFRENKSVIENYKNKIEDSKKNIDFYEKKMENKEKYIDDFNIQINNITTIFVFKKDSLKISENLLDYFKFYLNPIIEKEYEDYYDVIVSNRKNNVKELKMYIHNLNEAIYNLYTLDLSNTGINESNIENLSKVFKMINSVIKNKNKEIGKLFDDLKKIHETKNVDSFLLKFIDNYNDFENHILTFYELLNNLEIVLKSKALLINLKDYYDKIIDEKNSYLEKKETLLEKLKINDICPVCYELLDSKNCYISFCCKNNICIKCTEEWFITYKKTNCIYCNMEDTTIESYIKSENLEEKDDEAKENKLVCINQESTNEITNKEVNNKYLGSKVNFLNEFITELKDNDFKVIIFCNYNTIFQKLESICKENKIEYEDLEKGNINEIEKTICNYKYGNSKILFANSSLFSCGMNLENSSHIIFVHKMDEDIINQTIGRAQRLGRQNKLNIMYLEYENEKYQNKVKTEYVEIEKTSNNDIDYFDNYSVNYNELNNNSQSSTLSSLINNNEINSNQVTTINNEENKEETDKLELPSYDEVVDVNLDELIASLN